MKKFPSTLIDEFAIVILTFMFDWYGILKNQQSFSTSRSYRTIRFKIVFDVCACQSIAVLTCFFRAVGKLVSFVYLSHLPARSRAFSSFNFS